MGNNRKGKSKEYKQPDIKEENGLTITYDKEELHERFPHLINEITKNKRKIKIESVEASLNSTNHPRELMNPGAIDFIRRCTTIKEAFSILDYLLEREEISKSEYNSFKTQIQEENLQSFVNKHGGFKSPGYYEKKYRHLIQEQTDQSGKEE